MKKKVFILVLVLLMGVFLNFAQSQDKPQEKTLALVGGTLIDGTGSKPIVNSVILIKGDKIEAVGSADKITLPKEAEKIDVSGKWILPGFIDCHIHLTYPFNDRQYFTDTDSLATIRALDIMNKYLKCGVTSVRDVGSRIEVMKALNMAPRMGYENPIRLFSCGELITVTGGHGDGLNGTRTADGPWEWRKAVREMYKQGFRHIKISPTYTLEEVKAAVDEALTLNCRITSHGGGQSDTVPTTMTRIAVEGGVQCIEHLNEMEEDVLELMAEKGVYNVPTLAVYRELYRLNAVPKVLKEKRGWTLSMHENLFKKARELKIVMGIGTDSVGSFMKLLPEIYFTEMKYFLELGTTPMETIVAATKNGALILGKEDELGTIEKGKLADIQVLSGDPLKSFDVLGKPEVVIIGGKVKIFK